MSIEPEYQDALDYLYSYIDYSLTHSDRYSPESFDLGRMFTLMEALGNPQERYPIIHVAGTKGKGSVSALGARALQSHGYRVGLYTSPHLSDFVERIQVDGQPMGHLALAELVARIKSQVESIPQITTFEITTALALMHFAQAGVQAAVLEVGMGGRLDSTNIVDPLVTVITSLSYDHTKFLGKTLTEIAREKAGIVKQGVPLVLAPQVEEAYLAVAAIAAERSAPLTLLGRDYLFAPQNRALDGQSLLVWPVQDQPLADEYIESGGAVEWEPVRLHIPLLGAHQVENAATAYAALQVAREQGLAVSQRAIREGFASVNWPARFELLHDDPPLIVDAAHNRDSARKLRMALDDYFPGLPVILVFGVSEDKNAAGMLTELGSRVRRIIATKSTHPRAMDPERLVKQGHRLGRPTTATPDMETALEMALELAESEAVILVTGSLFVAAAGRDAWQARQTSLGSLNRQGMRRA